MKKKQVLSALVIASMVAGCTGNVYAAGTTNFQDMPNDWSTEALQNAVNNGLMSGMDGKLMPQGNLTRAQMASIINRAFGATGAASLGEYSDVSSSDWYYQDMAKAVFMETFLGSDGKLNPNADITRQEAFAVLARAFKLESTDTSNLSAFSDGNQVADWAAGSVSALIGGGYISGNGGKINPNSKITRAEFAKIMDNLVKSYIKGGSTSNIASGNVMVNTPDAILSDVTVSGDLIIGDGVGTGNLTVKGVKVEGRVLVRGGGINSIHFIDSQIGQVFVNNKNSDVRLVTDGETSIMNVNVATGALLEGNFDMVTVSNAPIELKGNINSLNVTEKSDVSVTSGAVNNITVNENAGGTNIEVSANAKAVNIKTNAPSTTMKIDGTVTNITATENADATKINATVSAKVEGIVTAATDTVLDIAGTVTNIEATSTATGTSINTKTGAIVDSIKTDAYNTAIDISSVVKSINVSENAKGSDITANKDAKITTITANAEGTTIKGEGKVDSVKANANNIKVDTPDTKVDAAKGTEGVTAGDKNVSGGSSSSTGSSSSGSSGGGGGGGSSSSQSSDTSVKNIMVAGSNAIVNSGDSSIYTVTVPYGTLLTESSLTATLAAYATKKVSLSNNVYTMVVTAQNGTTRTYTIYVTIDNYIPTPDPAAGAKSELKKYENIVLDNYRLANGTNTVQVLLDEVKLKATNTNEVYKMSAIVTKGDEKVNSTDILTTGDYNVLITVTNSQSSKDTATANAALLFSISSPDSQLSNDTSIANVKVAGINAIVDTNDNTKYTVTVPSDVELVKENLTLTIAAGAEYIINYTNKVFTVLVTAEDGTTQTTYTITVTQEVDPAAGAKSELSKYSSVVLNNTKLADGTNTVETLVNAVIAAVTNASDVYTVSAKVTIEGTNTELTTDTALTVANYNVLISVTNKNDSSDTATAKSGLKFSIVDPSSQSKDTNISNVKVSNVSAKKDDTDPTKYTVTVPFGTTLNESELTLNLANGAKKVVTLVDNVYTIEVTAEDDTTKTTYTITVTIAPDPAAGAKAELEKYNIITLSNSKLANGTNTVGTMIEELKKSVSNINKQYTVSAQVTKGSTSTAVDIDDVLEVDVYNVLITVTNKNSEKDTATAQSSLTFNITSSNSQSDDDASISNVKVAGAIATMDNMDTTKYTVKLLNGTSFDKSSLTLTLADGAKKEVTLVDNVYTVVVTAKDGITTKTYTVTVTFKSNDTSISNVKVAGVMAIVNSDDATKYTVTVPNGTILDRDSLEFQMAQGATMTSQFNDENVYKVIVLAEDRTTTKTYTITATIEGVTDPAAGAKEELKKYENITLNDYKLADGTNIVDTLLSAVLEKVETPDSKYEVSANVTVGSSNTTVTTESVLTVDVYKVLITVKNKEVEQDIATAQSPLTFDIKSPDTTDPAAGAKAELLKYENVTLTEQQLKLVDGTTKVEDLLDLINAAVSNASASYEMSAKVTRSNNATTIATEAALEVDTYKVLVTVTNKTDETDTATASSALEFNVTTSPGAIRASAEDFMMEEIEEENEVPEERVPFEPEVTLPEIVMPEDMIIHTVEEDTIS